MSRAPRSKAKEASPSPQRADARRNRELLLAAAEEVFAELGASASTEEIARRAGVGIGTLFRHFPTKEALLEVILTARLARLTADAEALTTAEDPGAAFFGFFEKMVDEAGRKKALTEALTAAGIDVKTVVKGPAAQMRAAFASLVTRAQRAGAVRGDVQINDVMALLVGATRAAEHAATDRGTRARTLAILFDGLRPR